MVVSADLGFENCPMEGFDKVAFDEILNLTKFGLTDGNFSIWVLQWQKIRQYDQNPLFLR